MLRARMRLLTVVLAVAVAGCGDSTAVEIAPPAAGPGFAASAQALEALGPGWRTSAAEPHACFASVEDPGTTIPYRYTRFALRLPAAVQSPTGAVTAFRFRSVRADGSVRAVLNCVIPATASARVAVARRFRIPLSEEDGGATIMGCVTENSFTNPCVLDPVVVVVEDEDEPCSYQPV
ncbi:hypothetical protein, partial [Longimicrobium sp.]|uniref:hypothetical protein n=1 Tax=Longimicrobium sp. TaxID=2029185 RepID=UPI002ED923CB